ncbi:MAG: hypothetical protein EOL88_06070 [Bacteroidia bacterium]|nr:hypothetical protein [Bacteroidales bacterium]NCD41643.1 hypothetical protein [Bacteroidia bacterium]
MNPEHYQKTVKRYSDEQLLDVVEHASLYHKDAILAALWEIEARGMKVEDIDSLKSSLESEFRMALEAEHLEEKENAIDPDTPFPELYSPVAIFWMTLLFNTLFGGLMLVYNTQKVNRQGRLPIILFTIFYTVAGLTLVSIIPIGMLFPVFYNLTGALVLREVMWKRHIPSDQKYRVKSTITPFLIGIVYSLLMLILMHYLGLSIPYTEN